MLSLRFQLRPYESGPGPSATPGPSTQELHLPVGMSPVRTLLVCASLLAMHLDRLPSIRALPPPAHGVPLKSIAFGSCNKEWMDTDAELWESVIKSSPSAWVWMGDAICECTTCHAAAPCEFAPANADAACA